MLRTIHTLIASILLSTSCNCGSAPPSYVGTGSKASLSDSGSSGDSNSTISLNKRYNLISKIGSRTVYVRRDCSPRPGAVFIGSNPYKSYDGSGTGVIMTSSTGESYIVTANHVARVAGKPGKYLACKLQIVTSEFHPSPGKSHKAFFAAGSFKRDIAVLRVDTDLQLETDSNTDPMLGSDVISIGYPKLIGINMRSPTLSVTAGVLATKNVTSRGKRATGTTTAYHRISAHLYFGNSGGGVWDKSGRLVGITSSFMGYKPPDRETLPYEAQYYIKPSKEIRYTAMGAAIPALVK